MSAPIAAEPKPEAATPEPRASDRVTIYPIIGEGRCEAWMVYAAPGILNRFELTVPELESLIAVSQGVLAQLRPTPEALKPEQVAREIIREIDAGMRRMGVITTAQYDAGIPILAEHLRPLLARIAALETERPAAATPEQVAEIRERLAKATPGAWRPVRSGEADATWIGVERPDPNNTGYRLVWENLHGRDRETDEFIDPASAERDDCDSRFIAHAPDDITRLLALADQQAARISELEMINDCQDMHLHAAREYITALETERGTLTAFAASVAQEGAGRLD